MKEVIIAINTLVFIGLIVFVAYILYGIVMMNIVFGGKCGLAAGPYYGNKIEINPDTISYDELISYEKGKIGLINRTPKEHPILLGFDKNNQLLWAVEMATDSLDIPIFSIDGLKLSRESSDYTFAFFNHSYSEPGFVKIKRNGKFKCFCLSPF